MKKFFSFIMGLLLFVLPVLNVNAEEADKKINFYIFYGDGCGYCALLHEFTDDLQKDKEYKDMFNIVDYEVWKSQDNAKLMQDVAAYFKDKADGVPYYVIGDKTFSGFSEESSPASIKAAIKEAYEDEKYEDIVAGIGEGTITTEDKDLDEEDDGKKNDMVGYIILFITAGIVIAIIFGRSKDTYYGDEDFTEEVEEEIVEEVEEEKEEEPVDEVKEEKKTTTKKTTSTKKNGGSSKKKSTSKKKR